MSVESERGPFQIERLVLVLVVGEMLEGVLRRRSTDEFDHGQCPIGTHLENFKHTIVLKQIPHFVGHGVEREVLDEESCLRPCTVAPALFQEAQVVALLGQPPLRLRDDLCFGQRLLDGHVRRAFLKDAEDLVLV